MRKYVGNNIWVWAVMFLAACTAKNKMSLKIIDTYSTNAISSGSGIAVKDDSLLIVGDDQEFVLKMNTKDFYSRKINLYPGASSARIPKDKKHDLESCTLAHIGNENYLLAFGSGGISPYRDSLFGIDDNDVTKNFSISVEPLYNLIQKAGGWKKSELDIEGAAMEGKYLLLMVTNSSRTGGGFHVSPKASVNDGLLDLILCKPLSVFKRLVNLPKIEKGKHLEKDFIVHKQISNIKIESNSDVYAQIDGELISSRSFDITVMPNRYLFLY